MSFKEFLKEHYINIFDRAGHPDHYDHAWDMVQKSYAPIGGIKGSGFSSKEDMKKNIDVKLKRRGQKFTSAVFYKKKGGRKIVAVASDLTSDGKTDLINTLKAEFKTKRSYIEASGPLLHTLVKHLGSDIHQHIIPRHKVNDFIDDKISEPDSNDPTVHRYPELKDHLYQREIGGTPITKLMLGHKGKGMMC